MRSMRLATIAAVMTCLGVLVPAQAATQTYWQVGTGNWSTGANWNDGEPDADKGARINNGGTAQINQIGEVTHQLMLAEHGANTAYIDMSAGTLTSNNSAFVGFGGTGTFTQTGGTVSLGDTVLFVGYNLDSSGTYQLSGAGTLSAGNVYVGYWGAGTFTQSGGTVTISTNLRVSYFADSTGTYTISGGQLSTDSLYVAVYGPCSGTLAITGADAEITVSNLLSFGGDSYFTAVAGSTIHMTGADFDNRKYIWDGDPADLAGLSNLRLIFEGGAGSADLFEVAGAADGGFVDNFALGSLTLGGADVGEVQLVDNFDNGNRGAEMESLFLHELLIGVGSLLDVNGLRLYVEGDVEALLDGWIDGSRLYDSTLTGAEALDAVFDVGNGWTTLVVVACTPPSITSHPSGATICDGESHQMCVSASGSPPLSYQWYRDESPIGGATSSCYEAAQDGTYYCEVSNGCGSADSNNATITIPECDDLVDCTDDSCVDGSCVFTPNDANCPDDGLFCNGTETCDALLDCVSSGDPCCQQGMWCNEETDQCDLMIPGDLDHDGDVDLDDYALFQQNFTGPQ